VDARTRALIRASIWDRAAIPHDAAYRYVSPIKRVFLPAYDVIILWIGLAGLVVPLQAVGQAVPEPWPMVLYIALAVAGIACFFGCAFPRLWRVEITGKVAILGLLSMLTVSMVLAGFTIPGHTGITITPILIGLMIPPLIRLWTLGSELGDRRAFRADRGAAS
jgi:hypothetical protein